MEWTRTRPTQPAHYFWRLDAESLSEPEVVQISGGCVIARSDQVRDYIAAGVGEFYGPIAVH